MEELTQEQIDKINADKLAEIQAKDAEIKKQYGYILKVENFDVTGNSHVAYFKKPSRMVVGMAMAEKDNNLLLACEYIYNDAIIKEVSDVDYFFNDDDIFFGLNQELQRLIKVKKSIFST